MANDPYRNFKFEVEVAGFTRAGFSMVEGLNQSIEIVEYREGGENETPRKMPGQSTYENLSLARGMSDDSDFLDWIQQLFNLDNTEGIQDAGDYRKTITIYLKNKSGERVKKWVAYRAWPAEKQNSSLDAQGNDVMIETLILAHEGLKEENIPVA